MEDGGGIALMVVVGVLVLGAAIVLCTHLVSAETEGARRGVFHRVVFRLPLQSIKIVVVVWQIVTQVRGALDRPILPIEEQAMVS